MTTYERADGSVLAVVDAVLRKYHGEVAETEPVIDVLMARNAEGGPAVTHAGYPAQAKIRVVGLKERAAGRGDVEILIDEANWDDLTGPQREALVDHELYHVERSIDRKTGRLKRDDLGRPKFKLRKHDWQFGWFNAVAQRHGEASAEVRQATGLWQENGQLYFGFAAASAFAAGVVAGNGGNGPKSRRAK